MQNTACEMLGWLILKLKLQLPGKISMTLDMQMTPPKSEKELKMKMKKESEKTGLKLNIQKIKIVASGLITSWQTEGEKIEAVTDFIFLGCKIPVDSDCSHNTKRCLPPGSKAMTNLDSVLKSKTSLCQQRLVWSSHGFSRSHVWVLELDHKEG